MFMRLTLHTESSQLICYANQLTGFYMSATLAFNGLRLTQSNTQIRGALGLCQVSMMEMFLYHR